MFRGKSEFVAFVMLLSGLMASGAGATPILLGNDFDGTLYDVDPTTGGVSNPRDTGIPWLCGIEFGADGTLYGLSADDYLYQIDPPTGVSVPIGHTGIDVTEGGLAFDVATSVMYGAQAFEDDLLYTINLTTGAAEVVGAVGTNDLSGLAFDGSGTLYGIDRIPLAYDSLITINKTNGSVETTTPIDLPTGVLLGMDFDPDSGELFIADGTGAPPFPPLPDGGVLYTVNTTSGALTPIGPTGLDLGLAGLVFTPEPTTLTLLALGGYAVTRRRGGRCR